MIPVSQALAALFAITPRMGVEAVPLHRAGGRVLARDVVATAAQPPFDASAMDGYAVPDADPAVGTTWRVVGEAAAGHPCEVPLGPGQAVRIFTGAMLPPGAVRVLIQEDTERTASDVTLRAAPGPATHIRPAAADFAPGARIEAPCRLTPARVALAAAMGTGTVEVARRPTIALIATGDELSPPGSPPGPGGIYASNTYGLAAMLSAAGAVPRLLPIAPDTLTGLFQALELSRDADITVTVGGASVGDHDLVAKALAEAGVSPAFHKVAMRPGKPLMAGSREGRAVVGLPGNPVSSMVCGAIFLRPMIDAALGLPARPASRQVVPTVTALPANGPREHYMRARLTEAGVVVGEHQDSALLSVLAASDALVVREPHAPPAAAGTPVEIVRMD
ncbi:MAG: molybdopterin molybdotransferase MoeA [Paracoccaceae bacterium]